MDPTTLLENRKRSRHINNVTNSVIETTNQRKKHRISRSNSHCACRPYVPLEETHNDCSILRTTEPRLLVENNFFQCPSLNAPVICLFCTQNFRLTILRTTLISYGAVFYENIASMKIWGVQKIACCAVVVYLYAALLSVHERTRVYVEQLI